MGKGSYHNEIKKREINYKSKAKKKSDHLEIKNKSSKNSWVKVGKKQITNYL